MSGVSRVDDGEVLNDTWAVQIRNMEQGSAADDGQPFVYPNVFSNVNVDPITPPRGFDWTIHQIDYSWAYVPEDSVQDNPTEHVSIHAEISEDDVPSIRYLGGGDAPTFEFGDVTDGVAASLDAVADRDEGPWLSHVADATYPHQFDGNGQSTMSKEVGETGTWKPPMPIQITDRTELDLHVFGLDSSDSINGEVQGIFQGAWTVWYQEIDTPRSGR